MRKSDSSSEVLALGAVPRVHLLPREVEATQRGKALRRGLVFALVGVFVLVLAGIAAATVSLVGANAALTSEQSRTAGLLVQQKKFGSVTSVQGQVLDIKAAEILGAKDEIAWADYFAQIQATLPAGMSTTSIQAALVPAATQAIPGTNPLVGVHVATVTIAVESPQATISDWLDSLAKLNGFVDATPGTVQFNTSTGRYDVNVVMHVSDKALANRFGAGGTQK
jgi:Tfp pilus assembly protein PilN